MMQYLNVFVDVFIAHFLLFQCIGKAFYNEWMRHFLNAVCAEDVGPESGEYFWFACIAADIQDCIDGIVVLLDINLILYFQCFADSLIFIRQ